MGVRGRGEREKRRGCWEDEKPKEERVWGILWKGIGGSLNPIPSPVHPRPSTPHLTPHTPHPTPYSPHSTPYTLHPHLDEAVHLVTHGALEAREVEAASIVEVLAVPRQHVEVGRREVHLHVAASSSLRQAPGGRREWAAHTHAHTHAYTHACMHARTHARTHAIT